MNEAHSLDAGSRRYQGKPLLRLLDCYVLSLTGHLDPAMEAKVARFVAKELGGTDWRSTLRQVVKLPPDMDKRVEKLWKSQPLGTDPLAFALAVSDENFAPMIDAD